MPRNNHPSKPARGKRRTVRAAEARAIASLLGMQPADVKPDNLESLHRQVLDPEVAPWEQVLIASAAQMSRGGS